MFFRKKERWDENDKIIRGLEANINQINVSLNELKKSLGEEPWGDLWQEMRNELQEGRREEEKWIRRQSESFEDLLEELQEEGAENRAAERLLKEYEQREQRLLALVSSQREQMELLERQIRKDTSQSEEKRAAWDKQFDVMNREAQKFMRACEMEEVGMAGEPLDYDMHEVLALVDTEDEQQAGTVAEVFCRGRYYRGRLLKKAQVAAFKRRTNAENDIG